jgi:hypothetical protein
MNLLHPYVIILFSVIITVTVSTSLTFRLPDKNFVTIPQLCQACFTLNASYPLYLMALIKFGGEYKLRNSALFNYLRPPAYFFLGHDTVTCISDF